MTSFHFAAPMLFAVQAGFWLCSGTLIGAAYFLALRWNVRLLTFGRAPLVVALLPASRFLLLAGLLAAIAACRGAVPLLLAAAGVLVARTTMTVRSGVPT